jgi:hypothetical protein
MRLWSLHPEYLDAKGLVALWREGLLGIAVIRGSSRGYRNHPQLKRFLDQKNPLAVLENYLWTVYQEAAVRGYSFNRGKLGKIEKCAVLEVTNGQLMYELSHLKRKLSTRDRARYQALKKLKEPRPHPLFKRVSGNVEQWEVAYYRATR